MKNRGDADEKVPLSPEGESGTLRFFAGTHSQKLAS